MSLAFIFPGQGSQSVGMLSEFADFESVIETFSEASSALGYDVWALCQNGPAEQLNQTQFTQPAILTASVALWRLWQQHNGEQPSYLAGHSLGEYSALVSAGVISLSDAAKLVRKRGELMQAAVPDGVGKMAAIIGLDDQAVVDACAAIADNEVVAAVNFNSPGQVVIAGHANAVERGMQACKDAGAKRALPLPVSVPSHCALMQPAAEELAQELSNIAFESPNIPVINNVDVVSEQTPAAIKDALIRQLYHPVRWTETIQWLSAQNVDTLAESGPGNVLSGLNKRISRDLTSIVLSKSSNFLAHFEQ